MMNVLLMAVALGGVLADDFSEVQLLQATAADAAPVTTSAHWAGKTLQCRYNPTNSPYARAEVEAAIRAAGAAWELKSGLKFVYAGTTDEANQDVVYDCLISWDLFTDLLKLGQARNFRSGERLVGTDIRISRLVGRDALVMVLSHEIGHGLGLRHDARGCLMQASPDGERLCFQDYANVSRLYPPFEVDGRPGLDCAANLSENRELYIPSIDGHYWARYRLNDDLSLTYIEHGLIEEDDLFLCNAEPSR